MQYNVAFISIKHIVKILNIELIIIGNEMLTKQSITL